MKVYIIEINNQTGDLVRHRKAEFPRLNILRNQYIKRKENDISNAETIYRIRDTETVYHIPNKELIMLVKYNKIKFENADLRVVSNNGHDVFLKIRRRRNRGQKARHINNNSQKLKSVSSNRNDENSNSGGNGGNNNPSGKIYWYHGTTRRRVKTISDLDINMARDGSDFGKGIYFTDVREYAELYAMSYNNVKTGRVLRAVWCNQSLDHAIHLAQLSGKDEWRGMIQGNNNSYRIVVFTDESKAWPDAILNGRRGYKVPQCDMVIGPVLNSDDEDLTQDLIGRLRKKRITIENAKNRLYSIISCQTIHGEKVMQLCCYKQEIIRNFIKK